jgi:hypothetical protein
MALEPCFNENYYNIQFSDIIVFFFPHLEER